LTSSGQSNYDLFGWQHQFAATSFDVFSVSPANRIGIRYLLRQISLSRPYRSGESGIFTGAGDRAMRDIRRLTSPIRFGIFEVDPTSGELRRQGSRVKLQEQPFQVLMMLLQRPGEVVTREEFQQTLWTADTFVDFERGLNRAINKLREALIDDADSPRFIETLPRRGYRFLASVETAGID